MLIQPWVQNDTFLEFPQNFDKIREFSVKIHKILKFSWNERLLLDRKVIVRVSLIKMNSSMKRSLWQMFIMRYNLTVKF